MSKCRRPNLPAFNLSVVHEHNEDRANQVTNAAACEQMSDVMGCIALGSWRDASNILMLKERGVTHVLNVAREVPPPSERIAMESGDFNHKTIPLQDCHAEDIGIYFEEAFNFIEEARQANGKVLVHCRRGISRSPAIVVGYLMRHERHTYESALAFVKERRGCVSLNLAFRALLEEYQPTPKLLTVPDMPINAAIEEVDQGPRCDSYGFEEFGLSAPESEKSSQPSGKESQWNE